MSGKETRQRKGLLARWYIFKLWIHELSCDTSLYTVWKDDGLCIVIHDACGKVWSAGHSYCRRSAV